MEGHPAGHPLQALTAPGTLPVVLHSTYFKGMLGIGKRPRISERKGPRSVCLPRTPQGQPPASTQASRRSVSPIF